jgi:hypothetical protein
MAARRTNIRERKGALYSPSSATDRYHVVPKALHHAMDVSVSQLLAARVPYTLDAAARVRQPHRLASRRFGFA